MSAVLDDFRLNLFGEYLTCTFVAIGLVLCWGAGSILSLGQGVFFGSVEAPLAPDLEGRGKNACL